MTPVGSIIQKKNFAYFKIQPVALTFAARNYISYSQNICYGQYR